MTTLVSIYRVKHGATGRVYIGQSGRKRRLGAIARWRDHVSSAMRGSKTFFHCAIRKYGEAAFEFEVIEQCLQALANDRERFHIAAHKSNVKGFGFNMSEGGDGGQNVKSEEVRRRISITKTGVPLGPCSPEKAKAISEAKLASGHRHSEETIRRIKEGRSHVISLTPEWRENIRVGLVKSATYKLTPEQVKLVEASLSLSDSTLAEKFSVSRKMIWRIRNSRYKKQIETRVS